MMANTNHFRVIVIEKKYKMKKLYDKWLKTSENPGIPDKELSFIRSVLGQTQLLLKNNFYFMENFLKWADEEKYLKINNNDLQGQLNMICIEIDDLDEKFEYLENRKANNWKRPTPVLQSPKITKKRKSRKTQRNPPVTSQKELVKSTRSVPSAINTSRDTSNRPKSLLTKHVEALPNRRPNSSTQSGLIETVAQSSSTSTAKASSIKPIEVLPRRPNSSAQSGLLRPNAHSLRPSNMRKPNTAGTPTSLPTPSRKKSCNTTCTSPDSSTRPGLMEKNRTAGSHPVSSSSSTRVIPLKSIRNKMLIKSISPQEQIVIAPSKKSMNTYRQIYEKRTTIPNRDKHITSDNEEEFFDAKSSLSVD